VSHPTSESTHQLFESLVKGDFDAFLSGCAEDLVLTVRGTDPTTTYVSKSEIPDWYLSIELLTGADLRTEVEVVRVEGTKSIILLRHEFVRHGIESSFAMVNVGAFADGLLARWATYPLSLPDYASALGIKPVIVPQLV